MKSIKQSDLDIALLGSTLVGAGLKGFADAQQIDLPHIDPDKLVLIAPAVARAVHLTLLSRHHTYELEELRNRIRVHLATYNNLAIEDLPEGDEKDNLIELHAGPKNKYAMLLLKPISSTMLTAADIGIGYSIGWVIGQLSK